MADTSKIPDIISRRYQKMKDLADPIFKDKQLNRALYSQDYYPKDDGVDYSLSDPHTFPVMRNYLSRLNPSHTKIRLDPRNAAQYESREVNQKIINWELSEIRLTNILYRLYYSAFMNGKGFFKTCWKYEPAVEIQEKDADGKVTRVKVLREIVNRAHVEFIPFENLLVPNQNVPYVREQPYSIEICNLLVGEMLDKNSSLEEAGMEPYWDKKWLEDLRKNGVEKKILDYQMDFVDDEGEELAKEDIAFRSAYVACLCMRTKEGETYYVPFEDNKVSGKIINKRTENEYWHGHTPVGDFACFPEDDNFYPLALIDVFADLQISASELLNLGLTNARQSTFQMWIAGTPAAQTPDWMFRTQPDGVIRVVGDPKQIQPVRVQDTVRSTMGMAQEVANRIERSSGVSSLYASGAGGSQINQTARGAQIIDSNIDTNIRMISDLFGEQVIKVIAEDFLELNAQYITEPQTMAITGEKGVSELVNATPEQISANFNVYVNAERMVKQTPASRQASLQNTIQVLQNIQNQSQGAIQVDLVPAVEALVDATPEMEEVADVVVSVDEKGKRDIAMLMRGQLPEAKVRDAHMDLIQIVSIFAEDNQLTPEQEALFQEYVEKHLRFIQSAQEVQQTVGMMQQASQLQQQVGGDGQGPENPGDQTGLPNEGYNLGQIGGSNAV